MEEYSSHRTTVVSGSREASLRKVSSSCPLVNRGISNYLFKALSGYLSGQIKSGQRWSGQNRPTDVARDMVLLSHLLLIRQVRFRSPTPWSAFQDVTVVQQTVEHGGDGGAVTEQFAPVFHRAVRSK